MIRRRTRFCRRLHIRAGRAAVVWACGRIQSRKTAARRAAYTLIGPGSGPSVFQGRRQLDGPEESAHPRLKTVLYAVMD